MSNKLTLCAETQASPGAQRRPAPARRVLGAVSSGLEAAKAYIRCPATLFGPGTARLQRGLHCLREAGELPHEHLVKSEDTG
eukprot:scaffold17293_cov87-Phaeocystis_antarctica.AAC.2